MANGLLGMGGLGGAFGAPPPAGLLGKYFDPRQMKNQQIKQALLGAGVGMLQNGVGSTGQVLGQALAGGIQGANNAGLNYKADAMGYQALEQQMQEQKRKDAEYQEKEKQKSAIMQMISEDTPENQQLALTNPQGYADLMMQRRFAGPGEGFTLGEGQQRFDAMGRPIAAGAPKVERPPAGIQEYEYAKQQGFPGTFQDWEASKRGGMSLQVDPSTGAVTFQQGGNIRPMTEAQSKDTVFATRAEGALGLIDQYGQALTSLPETVAGGVPVVGNYAKSPQYQQAEQAGLEFLQAILRKDTGAAITPQETASYGLTYLPRPGDSAKVLEQKKQSRRRALEAIKAGMPPQAILAQEKALLQGGQAPAVNPQAPRVRTYNPATGKLE